ncbi:MAG: response regulator transcription factor [Kangiellaceae bacterium]|nr:response regulator transcription factor [Kangiellaceae bacterium]
MSNKKSLLLLEDDDTFARVLTKSLARKSVAVTHCSSISQLDSVNRTLHFDYIVIDLFLDQESGLSSLPQLRKRYPSASILILTGYASIVTTVQAIKLGADNYLPKPANASQVLKALQQHTSQSKELAVSKQPLSVERMEWEHIQATLLEHGGNISATARALGMHRRTLQRKLSKKPKAH